MTHGENRISDLIDGGLHEKSAIDRAKYELHLRRRAAIEVAATEAWEADAIHNPIPNNPYAYRNGFKAGAEEVIGHPERYGLVPAAHTAALQERVKELEAENERYREALESIVNTSIIDAVAFPLQTVSEFFYIAKKALKQEADNG